MDRGAAYGQKRRDEVLARYPAPSALAETNALA
jgi:hypothetical protein